MHAITTIIFDCNDPKEYFANNRHLRRISSKFFYSRKSMPKKLQQRKKLAADNSLGNDWVLLLKASEVLPAELIDEIDYIFAANHSALYSEFRMTFKNRFLGLKLNSSIRLLNMKSSDVASTYQLVETGIHAS